MNDPERPPLDGHTLEDIKVALHAVDERHWPLLIEFQVPNYHPLNKPVPPQRPIQFKDAVVAYALDLFKREADFYVPFRADANYPPWLSKLVDRTEKKIIEALKNVEDGNSSATVWFHGVSWLDVNKAVHIALWHAKNSYVQSSLEPPHTAASLSSAKVGEPAARKRMSASVYSPSAARKMEAYMQTKGLNQTEFAIRAGTTDKTIRKFRQTGKVKRSILGDIAKAIGTTREEILS